MAAVVALTIPMARQNFHPYQATCRNLRILTFPGRRLHHKTALYYLNVSYHTLDFPHPTSSPSRKEKESLSPCGRKPSRPCVKGFRPQALTQKSQRRQDSGRPCASPEKLNSSTTTAGQRGNPPHRHTNGENVGLSPVDCESIALARRLTRVTASAEAIQIGVRSATPDIAGQICQGIRHPFVTLYNGLGFCGYVHTGKDAPYDILAFEFV